MFTIRQEMLQAFRHELLRDVRERLIAALRETLPQETGRRTPEQLHAFCDRGIVKADSYGLQSERSVYVFLAAMLCYGEDFDTNERTKWSRDVLRDRRMEQDIKAGLLELRILKDTGQEV